MFMPLPELKSWSGEVPGEVPGGEQIHGTCGSSGLWEGSFDV